MLRRPYRPALSAEMAGVFTILRASNTEIQGDLLLRSSQSELHSAWSYG
jgi:hypothetical protein